MRRRIGLLVALCAVSLGTPGAVGVSYAHTEVCVASGDVAVAPLGYAALGAPVSSATFSANMSTGVCQPFGHQYPITGTITGWCELTTGSGEVDGHQFTLTGTAFKFVLQGEVTGTLNFTAEAVALPCVPEQSGSFRATSTFALTH